MNACKQYRQQLALLSVQAVDEREKAVALVHVNQCADCRAYWQQLQTVTGLLRRDAERLVDPTHSPVFVRRQRPRPVLTFPSAIAFALGVAVICAVFMLFREPRLQPKVISSSAPQPAPISVPTVADSRRLANNLDALREAPDTHRDPDFVFSVGTRYEGP